jgi:hypothetical protein
MRTVNSQTNSTRPGHTRYMQWYSGISLMYNMQRSCAEIADDSWVKHRARTPLVEARPAETHMIQNTF